MGGAPAGCNVLPVIFKEEVVKYTSVEPDCWNIEDPPPPPEPVSTVIGKVEPSPLVKVIVFKLTLAVVNNEPVD